MNPLVDFVVSIIIYSSNPQIDINMSREGSRVIAHIPLCIVSLYYRPLNGPLFHLDLVLDENGSHFSTDLDAFKPALVSIFDRGIQATHSVPQMERVKLIKVSVLEFIM